MTKYKTVTRVDTIAARILMDGKGHISEYEHVVEAQKIMDKQPVIKPLKYQDVDWKLLQELLAAARKKETEAPTQSRIET